MRRGRIREYVNEHPDARHVEKGCIWEIPCQVVLPCATENELDKQAALALIKGGCIAVGEGANMPTTPSAVKLFHEAGVAFAPGKAANAGGVATSALQMQQNASCDAWTFKYTERRLREIMTNIHRDCWETAADYGFEGNYVVGANIAGFCRVAEAMLAFGVI